MKDNKCFFGMFLSFGFGLMVGVISIYRIYCIKITENKPDNLYKNLNMINQWLILKSQGIELATGLIKNDIKRIAIYGMGIYGRHLVRELLHTDIEIVYCMDQKTMDPFMGVHIIKAKSGLPEVDLVVNSVIYAHDEISRKLIHLYKCPVVSLEDLVFESYQKEEG